MKCEFQSKNWSNRGFEHSNREIRWVPLVGCTAIEPLFAASVSNVHSYINLRSVVHICNSLNSAHIFSVIVNIHATRYITCVVVYLLVHFMTRSTLSRKYIFITWCICNPTLLIFPLFSRHTYPSFNDLYKTSSWHISRMLYKNESCRFCFSTIYSFCDWLRFFFWIFYFLFRSDEVFELDMVMLVVRRRFIMILFLVLDQYVECLNVDEMV